MAQRVFIIHGWGGKPEHGWYQWMTDEMTARNIEAHNLSMPNTDNPLPDEWISAIEKAVGTPDAETYFVTHSLSCQAIIRYAATLPADIMLGGALFVAGFFGEITGLDDVDQEHYRTHWLAKSFDANVATKHLGPSVALFSDNDKYVPLDCQNAFKDFLNAKILVMHNRGHFSGDTNTTELPEGRDELLALMKR